MKKVKLAVPTQLFTEEFLQSIAVNGLYITGNDLPLYLNEKVNEQGFLFRPDITYSCKIVNNNAILVGTSIN